MSKQYIIMYKVEKATSYYCGYSNTWNRHQWVSCLDTNPKVKIYSSPQSAEKDLWKIRNEGTVGQWPNDCNIYEYQPEQVIPAKVGKLVTTEKETVLSDLHFVEVTLREHSPYCCGLITKAMNYIKET